MRRNVHIALTFCLFIATPMFALGPARADCPDPNAHPVPEDAKQVGNKTEIPCDCNRGFSLYGGKRCISTVQKDRWSKVLARTCLGAGVRQAFQNWNWLSNKESMLIVEGADPGNRFHIDATPKGPKVSTLNYSSLDPDIVTFELGKALFISEKISTRQFKAWADGHTSWIEQMKGTPQRGQHLTSTSSLMDQSWEAVSAFGYAFRAVYCGIPGGSEGNSIMQATMPWLPPPEPPGGN